VQSVEKLRPWPETLNSLNPAASEGTNENAPAVFTVRLTSALNDAKRFAVMDIAADEFVTRLPVQVEAAQ
jgi:hypothetical protein